jgi:putative intracellular protease/amidase
MTKILIVLTSGGDLDGHETGLWLEEFAVPYWLFKDAGYDLVLASTQGGAIPIDKGSMQKPYFTEACEKFMHDADAIGLMTHTKKLDTIDLPADFDAIYLPGGHGCCVDFVGEAGAPVKKAIETMYDAGKLVCAVCHAPVGLIECVSGGAPLVAGKKVTGFSDSEEDAVGLTGKVPYLIEAKFKELGGNYEKADDWQSNVCVDGHLITGQNPSSSEAAGKAVIMFLSA